MRDGQLVFKGRLGRDLQVEEGRDAAELCALNALAALKEFLGDLDKIKRVVKLVGHVASAMDFSDQAKVVNGASELMVSAFGESGKHARMAIGVQMLPAQAPVAVELIVEAK